MYLSRTVRRDSRDELEQREVEGRRQYHQQEYGEDGTRLEP